MGALEKVDRARNVAKPTFPLEKGPSRKVAFQLCIQSILWWGYLKFRGLIPI